MHSLSYQQSCINDVKAVKEGIQVSVLTIDTEQYAGKQGEVGDACL